MKKEKITTNDVKVGYYHESGTGTGTGVAVTPEAVEKGLFIVFGGEIEELLSKYPDVDIKIVK